MNTRSSGVAALLLLASCAPPREALYEPWCNDWRIMVRDNGTSDGRVSSSDLAGIDALQR